MAEPDPVGDVTAFKEIAMKLTIPAMKATIPAKKPIAKRA
jgi:hypothetical protein